MNLTVFVIGLDVDLVEHNCGPGRLRGGLARHGRRLNQGIFSSVEQPP
jgi:hypothetical protein